MACMTGPNRYKPADRRNAEDSVAKKIRGVSFEENDNNAMGL